MDAADLIAKESDLIGTVICAHLVTPGVHSSDSRTVGVYWTISTPEVDEALKTTPQDQYLSSGINYGIKPWGRVVSDIRSWFGDYMASDSEGEGLEMRIGVLRVSRKDLRFRSTSVYMTQPHLATYKWNGTNQPLIKTSGVCDVLALSEGEILSLHRQNPQVESRWSTISSWSVVPKENDGEMETCP